MPDGRLSRNERAVLSRCGGCLPLPCDLVALALGAVHLLVPGGVGT